MKIMLKRFIKHFFKMKKNVHAHLNNHVLKKGDRLIIIDGQNSNFAMFAYYYIHIVSDMG